MKSKFAIKGHPVHPMLVAFPVALYTITLVAFIVARATGDAFWFFVGTYANIAGVVMAGVAALPGFIDLLNIPRRSAARATGVKHMLLNVTALGLFIASAVLQGRKLDEAHPSLDGTILLPLLGVLCTLGAGWLGWKMVQTHHVGVALTPEQERLEPSSRAPRQGHSSAVPVH